MPDEPADSDNLLGAFIRAQRQMANLSLLAVYRSYIAEGHEAANGAKGI